MSKKSGFRDPFDNQHGKWEQTVLKSERNHFYNINWQLGSQLSSKKCLLMIGKISGLFDVAIWDVIISKRENVFSTFFCHFWNVDKIL